FGALWVLRGKMLPGDPVPFTSYLVNMYKPVRGLAKLSTDFSKTMASADRISEVLDIEPEIQHRPDAIDVTNLRGKIVFQNASFDYGDGKDVLQQISFSVSPGQRLALVGVAGAGKSTIVSLLLRLYEPQEGSIFIDEMEIKAKVPEALDRMMVGKTCILITHDLPSVTDADLVLVLEEGRIIECGKHAELVATSSRYRQLYEGRPANPPNPEGRQTPQQSPALPAPDHGRAREGPTN